MGFWRNVAKEAWRENIETIKATIRETNHDAPIIGFFVSVASDAGAYVNEWEEVTIPRSFLGIGRGREIGMIKANRKDIDVMAISDNGFYVKKGQKDEAVAYLNSINLKAE